ncbi:mandelate racemase [Haloferax sp. Atlit-12N]|uniref:mandelate racemase/muconate lactonizing enzyme family protein n=1 Tax=Haloferax sp. Atlit-12N TaxID=2077203 RepID=UPI000E263BE7|nr:mandelate racemase/muconate lactonizing enzyme family protein [Haloferax sp. Atlit-12N]RDZ62618.1 mandelate racemase [Haloferax sp. Atlit-12N]
MDIRDIQAYAVSSPIDPPQERQFHGGMRRLNKRDVVIIVVDTADGERGFATAGASSSAMREYFEGDSQGTFADVVNESIADQLIGETVEEPADVQSLVRELPLPERAKTEAASALDVALHDIRGKELGAPVYELLADQYDDHDGAAPTDIPLYASAGMYMEPEGYVQQAKTIEELGFFGYKYRPGIGPDEDRRTVSLLADALDDTEIMLDVHTWWKLEDGYDEETVRDLVKHAGTQGAYWVEEPLEPEDYEGYVEMAKQGVPLAGGESESTDGLVKLGETGAVDFLQGDVRHHRGFSGCQAAIELSRGREMEFVPHNFGTWFGLIANAHLVASAPEVRLLEYPVFENDPVLSADHDPGMYQNDVAFDIIEGQPDIEDGQLSLSDDPGLGIEIDLDVVEKYPFQDGPWTEFHYHDEDEAIPE